MRISKKDWGEYQIELQLMQSGLALKKLDSRIGGVWVIKYYQNGSGTYDNVSPVLHTRHELDTYMSALRKGVEIRNKQISDKLKQMAAVGPRADDAAYIMAVLGIRG